MESVQKAVTIRIKELTASVSELEEAQHGNGSPRLDPEDSFIDGYGRLCLSPSRSNSDDIYGAGEQALLAQSSESFDEAEIERLKTKLSMSSASQSGDKSISRKASKALINSDLEMRAYYFSQALSAKKKRWCAIRARTVRDSKPALSMQRFEEFLEDSEGHSSAEWAAKQDWLRFARHGEFESRSPQAPPIRIHSEIQGMKSPGDWRHIKPFMTSSPATHHSKHVSALGIPSLSENRSVLLEASRAIDNYHTSRDTEVLKRIILDIHKRLVQEEAAFLEEERKEREKASQIKPPLSTGLPDLTVIEMSDKDAIASSFIPPSNGRKLERKASLASFDAEGDRKTSKSSESSRPIGPDKSNYREVSNINSESTPKSIVGATSTINPADRVRAIYEQCNPSKLGEVPQLLQKYAGQERTLIAKLEKKYAAQLAASSANLLLQSAGSLNFSTSSSTTSSSPFQQLQSSSSGPSLFQSNSSSTKMGGESQTLSQPCSSLFGGSNSSSDNASLFGAKSNLFQTPSASSSNALGGATIRSGAENAVSRITAIYQQHNPSKLGEIPQLLEKYKGRELELLSKVERKYNIQQQPQSGGVFATSQVQGSQPSGTGAGSLFGKSTSATTAGPFASWGNQQSAATNLSGSSSLFSGGTNAVASTPFATPNNGAGGSSLFSGGNPMNTGGTESIPTPFATNKSNSSGGSITSFGGGFAKAFGSSTATAPGFKPTPFSGGSTPFSGSSNTGLFQGGSANKGSPFGSTIQQNSLFDGANSSGFGGANKTPTPFGGGIGMTGGGAAKPSLWGKK